MPPKKRARASKKFSGPAWKKPKKDIQAAAVRAVRSVMMKNIETKESTQTISDGTENFHNNFVTLSSNLLATTQGTGDPHTSSTSNRIGDRIPRWRSLRGDLVMKT
jgi:hypothetical protein